MPSYKLTYFDGKGRAEAARLLFALAKQDYENELIPFDKWGETKKSTPQGALPVLNVDGKKISQSMAINRFLAREFGLYGKDNFHLAIVDQILDTSLDMFLPMTKIFFNKNEDEKKVQMAEYMSGQGPESLGKLENLIKQKGENGFAVGKSATVADCVLYSYIDNCQLQDSLEKFPLLKKNRETFAELPTIKKYLANRTKTAF